jgi:hypothetical protein
MYTMSPEDRLRLVVRQQNDLRDEMARERLATAAAARRSTARPAPRAVRGAGIRRVGVLAQHLLHAIRSGRVVAPHGVTH